jgi:hypothetical protein
VNLLGQTRDLGAGGVRFVVPDKLPIGRQVEYVITRSSGNRGDEIECTGNILRCVKKYDYPSYEVVATIEIERKKPQPDAGSISEMPDDLSQTSDAAHRYKPMLRLLSDEDDRLLANPALRQKFRMRRCELFPEYLRSLTGDYRATLAGVRLLMSQADTDRPDLAMALFWNRVSFAIARCRIEVRLRLYALGVPNTDALKLEVQGLARSLDMLQRQFSFLAESAAWGG